MGEGIHLIEFMGNSLDGAHGTNAFVHPSSTGSVLVELVGIFGVDVSVASDGFRCH